MGKYDFGYIVYDGSTVQWALNTIKKNSTVLEFGPYNGNLTKHLKEQLCCRVDIVEIDREAGLQASKFAENALVGPEEGNIEKYNWCEKFKGKQYDYIVFLDVIEHLYDTQKVLSTVKKFLKDDGSVLLSIPNIAHNSIILNLIKNEFNYTPLGLLDNTHIRFFTYYSILKLAKKLGYSAKMNALQLAVGNNEISSSYQDVDKGVANYLKRRPYADVYQYLVELKKCEVSEDPADFTIHNMDNRKQLVVYIREQQDEAFSEKKAVRLWTEPSHIDLETDFSEFPELESFRIDPMDCSCILENIRITADGDPVDPEKLRFVNGRKFKNGKVVFTDNDPQIFINATLKGIKALSFKCDVEMYDDPFIKVEYGLLSELDGRDVKIEKLLDDFNRVQNEKNDLKTEITSIKEELDAVSAIKKEQDDTLYDIYRSRAWKMITRCRNIKHKLRRK